MPPEPEFPVWQAPKAISMRSEEEATFRCEICLLQVKGLQASDDPSEIPVGPELNACDGFGPARPEPRPQSPPQGRLTKPLLASFKGVSQNWGYHFGGVQLIRYSIWGSILGSPYFGKPTILVSEIALALGACFRMSSFAASMPGRVWRRILEAANSKMAGLWAGELHTKGPPKMICLQKFGWPVLPASSKERFSSPGDVPCGVATWPEKGKIYL